MLMARAYSDDLRRKLLEAYDQGKGSLAELAEQFCVSTPWAWKISAARKRTGQVEQPSYRHGPKSRVDEQVLSDLLSARPDMTLPELQREVTNKSGLQFSTQHLWRVLKRMGFRLKKSRSTPKSGTRKPTGSAVKSSSKRSARFRLKS